MNNVVNFPMSILPILAAAISFGLGILVAIRNPRHPVNIGFGLGMLSLALIETGDAIFLLSGIGHWDLFGKRVSLTGEVMLPSAWFLFSLAFARANYQEVISHWKKLLAALYIGSAFFIFWIKSPLFVFIPENAETHEILLIGPIGRYFYIFMLIGMILNLIHLENTLRSSSGITRQQIKYVIISIVSILSFYIYLTSKALLFSFLNMNYIPVTSVVILISCGLLSFTIMRNHLLNVNIFVSRYVIYNSLTVLFVGAYLLIVGIVAQGIKLSGGSFETFWGTIFIFTSVLGMAIVLLSARLRRKFQLFVARHFYRHKYEFRDKWLETTEKIGPKTDLLQIQRIIVDMISGTMGAKEVHLWLYEPAQHRYYLAMSTVMSISQVPLDDGHSLILYIRKNLSPFLIKEIPEDEEGYVEDIAPLIAVSKAVLCTPLIAGGEELIGFILQGEDISGEPYRRDDFDLLRAISSHAANRIKIIYLTQELLVAKEAETFHQVSTFFIHDLKNLVSTLSLLAHNAENHIGNPSFQEDAMRTLRTTVSKMNTMISNLTLLSKGLIINQSPVNLNELIEETLSTMNGQVLPRLVKRLDKLPRILADGEQLQKVCLNLLINAIEASPPHTEIEIRTSEQDGEVILTVSDHGCGMSQEFLQSSLFRPFRTTKSKGLGIGLFQCKKIIEAHGGRIEVDSKHGEGSEFRVKLPLSPNGIR